MNNISQIQTDAARMSDAKASSVDHIVSRLMEEPLTHLMLGHRELFHSNLLAWFFRHIPESADLVFSPLTSYSQTPCQHPREVLREKSNLDLVFRWPGRHPLAIENKVFSLPDEEQLISYAAKASAKDESCAFWLLSLSDPGWENARKELGGSEWCWLSYAELAKRIQRSLKPEDCSYAAETMRHYSQVVGLLSNLVERVVVQEAGETVALSPGVESALKDDRLESSLAKLRARSIAQRVRQALNNNGILNGTVKSDLTNGLPLIEWFCSLDRAPGMRFGWQLQGNQFRLALITPHLSGRSAVDRQARFSFAKSHEDLFAFDYLDSLLGTVGLPAKPFPKPANPLGFNRYDPDFVYRYKLAPDITVEQLESAAVAVARRIRRVSHTASQTRDNTDLRDQ